jgi:hypothetical protein
MDAKAKSKPCASTSALSAPALFLPSCSTLGVLDLGAFGAFGSLASLASLGSFGLGGAFLRGARGFFILAVATSTKVATAEDTAADAVVAAPVDTSTAPALGWVAESLTFGARGFRGFLAAIAAAVFLGRSSGTFLMSTADSSVVTVAEDCTTTPSRGKGLVADADVDAREILLSSPDSTSMCEISLSLLAFLLGLRAAFAFALRTAAEAAAAAEAISSLICDVVLSWGDGAAEGGTMMSAVLEELIAAPAFARSPVTSEAEFKLASLNASITDVTAVGKPSEDCLLTLLVVVIVAVFVDSFLGRATRAAPPPGFEAASRSRKTSSKVVESGATMDALVALLAVLAAPPDAVAVAASPLNSTTELALAEPVDAELGVGVATAPPVAPPPANVPGEIRRGRGRAPLENCSDLFIVRQDESVQSILRLNESARVQ